MRTRNDHEQSLSSLLDFEDQRLKFSDDLGTSLRKVCGDLVSRRQYLIENIFYRRVGCCGLNALGICKESLRVTGSHSIIQLRGCHISERSGLLDLRQIGFRMA